MLIININFNTVTTLSTLVLKQTVLMESNSKLCTAALAIYRNTVIKLIYKYL